MKKFIFLVFSAAALLVTAVPSSLHRQRVAVKYGEQEQLAKLAAAQAHARKKFDLADAELGKKRAEATVEKLQAEHEKLREARDKHRHFAQEERKLNAEEKRPERLAELAAELNAAQKKFELAVAKNKKNQAEIAVAKKKRDAEQKNWRAAVDNHQNFAAYYYDLARAEVEQKQAELTLLDQKMAAANELYRRIFEKGRALTTPEQLAENDAERAPAYEKLRIAATEYDTKFAELTEAEEQVTRKYEDLQLISKNYRDYVLRNGRKAAAA